MTKAFDSEFTTLTDVAMVQVQTKHDASLLDTISTNIRNDINILNVCIKELRHNIEELKQIYEKCSFTYLLVQNFDDQIKEKVKELQTLSSNLLKLDQKIVNFEHDMESIHNNIRGIEAKKEKTLRRYSLLRDHLAPQIVVLQSQLEECCTAKSSFDTPMFIE